MSNGLHKKELESVTETLNLEYGANRRYALQIERLDHPRIIGLLEGVKRNEGGSHRGGLEDPPAKCAQGKGRRVGNCADVLKAESRL